MGHAFLIYHLLINTDFNLYFVFCSPGTSPNISGEKIEKIFVRSFAPHFILSQSALNSQRKSNKRKSHLSLFGVLLSRVCFMINIFLSFQCKHKSQTRVLLSQAEGSLVQYPTFNVS